MLNHLPKILQLFLAILIPLAVGVLSGIIGMEGIQNWYPSLEKPSFTPPGRAFGPVWTVLYSLMGVGLNTVWNSSNQEKKRAALWSFWVQLLFNFLWTFCFFGLKSPSLALADSLFLMATIGWMVLSFYEIKPVIGILQIPYFLWAMFATLITFEIWRLNS